MSAAFAEAREIGRIARHHAAPLTGTSRELVSLAAILVFAGGLIAAASAMVA